MKITFVGSSHGVPEPNRKCSCIMIETNNRVYFLDMGTSAIDALCSRGIAVDTVKAVFISHMHGDHTNGLIQFVDLLTWFYKTPNPAIFLPDIHAANVIHDWLKVTLNNAEKKMDYRPIVTGKLYNDNVLQVTAIATQHCPGSHAYLMEAEGKSVLFTNDLRNPSVDFPAIPEGKNVDLLVCESAHFPATDYLPILEKGGFQKVCVTHYSDRYLDSVLQLQRVLENQGIPTVRATDGLEISL